MKIKTPYFTLEIEILFIITLLISIFSLNFRNYLSNYYICYLFILFHELSHMFVASIFGKEINKFKLSLSGVNISFKEEYLNSMNIFKIKNILIYAAGPLSNILLSILFINNKMIFSINIFLAILNLLPIYPLDGYNILECILNIFFNVEKCNIIIDIISKFLFLLLFILAIFQLIILKNPSILIFLIYIIILNESNKEERKIKQIIKKSVY